jgi:hypothetical protein
MSKFANIEEVKQKTSVKISTGIHEVKIVSVDVEEVKGKDGKEDWKKGSVVFECTKTNEGRDSVGKTIKYDILYPQDEVGFEKLGKRLIHIFSKISTKEKIGVVKQAIQKMDFNSIEELVKCLKKLAEGRSLRLKVVATQDGLYPTIPLYYAGYAETIDTVPSELKYDDSKEGTKQAPKGAENPSENSSENTSVSSDDTDDLPF